MSVVSEFKELGNPFEEQGDELIAVHTRDIMDSAVVSTVQNVLQIGKSQYDSYVQESNPLGSVKQLRPTICLR